MKNQGSPSLCHGKEGRELCNRLRFMKDSFDTRLLRKLQRYTVQVPKRQWQCHLGLGIEMVHERYPVLISPELHYDSQLGLVLDREDHSVDAFIV